MERGVGDHERGRQEEGSERGGEGGRIPDPTSPRSVAGSAARDLVG
jgi:hypothetical protein